MKAFRGLCLALVQSKHKPGAITLSAESEGIQKVNGYTTSGTHEVQFNATNLASGVYCYRLTIGNFTEVKKMTLVK